MYVSRIIFIFLSGNIFKKIYIRVKGHGTKSRLFAPKGNSLIKV